MDRYDDAMLDEMDQAEGAADHYDEYDEMDAGDGMDSGDEADEGDEGDEFDGGDEGDEMDAGDEYDELDAGDDGFESADETGDMGEDEWDQILASALGAEDTDEFFKRIARGLSRVVAGVRRAAPMIGKIARAVGPVASLIPGVGTAIGGVANVVGQLMADEASEDDALDAFAELAVRNNEAVPLVAALAARRVLGAGAARLPTAVRVQAIRTIRRAATQLVNRGGPTAIRAIPRIARSVRRTAVSRRTPINVRPRVFARTAARVSSRGSGLRRRLMQPSAAGRQVIHRALAAARAGHPPAQRVFGHSGLGLGQPGGGYYGHNKRRRRIVIQGPVTITIRPH
ncbi:MAG: hypothetical protein JWO25_1431 [Alphaproteobacteria bacterium]|nr:hypothetical protein [Alphaproteobacteria bacterium]